MTESLLYNTSTYSIWTWCTEILFFGMIPFIVFLFNICVIRKIRYARMLRFASNCSEANKQSTFTEFLKKRRNILKKNAKSRSQSRGYGGISSNKSEFNSTSFVKPGSISHTNRSTTITLLWVSFYLILTTFPVTLVFAIQTAIPLGNAMSLHNMGQDPTWRNYLAYYASRVIIKEIGMSHHVGNVFIYLVTSKKFRGQLKNRFWRGATSCSPTSNATNTSEVTSPAHLLKTLKSPCHL